jgi:hypothetical protein
MGFALFYTSVLSLSVGAEKIRIIWAIHSKPIAKMYAAVIMMLAVLAPHHWLNVGGGRVYYFSAHIVHPASAAHTAVVVFSCPFAR